MNTLTISKKNLSETLSLVGSIITRSTLPILDHVLVNVKKNDVQFTASDLENTISQIVDVKSKEVFSFTIDPKLIINLCNKLSDEEITFEVKKENICINSFSGTYNFVGQEPKDFPEISTLEKTSKTTIAIDILKESLCKTIPFVNNEMLRPTLCGIYLEQTKKDIMFSSTNGNFLSHVNHKNKEEKEFDFIIPTKSATLISKLKGEIDVTIKYNTNNAQFCTKDTTVTCKLIEGKYPNYNTVIPKEHTLEINVNRIELISAVKKSILFENNATHQVEFSIEKSKINIKSVDINFGKHSLSKIDCVVDMKEEMNIGFNSLYLLNILKVITSENIVMRIVTNDKAILFLPIHDNKVAKDEIYLLMPMMITTTE